MSDETTPSFPTRLILPTDTDAHGEASASAPKPLDAAAEPTSESVGSLCLWCGMTIVTEEDEIRHQEQCAAARGEAPSPAEYIEAVRNPAGRARRKNDR